MAIEVWVKVKDFGGPQIGMSMFSMNMKNENWVSNFDQLLL